MCAKALKKDGWFLAGCNGVEEREQMLDPGFVFDVYPSFLPSLSLALDVLGIWDIFL